MKRRSFLVMLGIAPVAAVATPMPKAAVEAGGGLTMLDVKLGECPPLRTVRPRIDALADDVRSHLEAARQEREELSRLVAELALD